ncbi:MAG: hypothetical protein SGPRY_003846 [Prymnesium sp.]
MAHTASTFQIRTGATLFFDVHDGDQKTVSFNRHVPNLSDSVTIRPHANNQTWRVDAVWDPHFMNGSIDFNVMGKPEPPPVNLTLSYKKLFGKWGVNAMCQFNDPTGAINSPRVPVNAWISVATHPISSLFKCPSLLAPVAFADMHDGDFKQLSVDAHDLTIMPYGNNQSWAVHAKLDENCTALIDFNVPGKPNPPSVKLRGVLQQAYDGSWGTRTVTFYDPTGSIAPAGQPLNAWLSI